LCNHQNRELKVTFHIMKMIRAELNYPATTPSKLLGLGNSRASCSFPATGFALPETVPQTRSNRRESPARTSPLSKQIAAELQQTEFMENVIFAALGASGLVGVAVSLL
jgi:hypothetical protein